MPSHYLGLAVLDTLPLASALAWSSCHSCCSLLKNGGHFNKDNTSVQAGHESTKDPASVQAAQEHKGRHRYTGTHTKTQEHKESRTTETIPGMECWDEHLRWLALSLLRSIT